MSNEGKFHYEIGFASHQGLEKEVNEDNYCAEHREDENGIDMGMIAVADGIGGFSLGEIASKIAVNQIEKFYKLGEFKQMFEEAEFLEPRRVIQELYTRINHVVRTLMEKENRAVGCTLVSGYFYGDYAYIAGVGNSRAYIIRGSGIKKLTEDHGDPLASNSLAVADGEENLNSTRNIAYVNSLGSNISLQAEIAQMRGKDGDIFLFCSDGLFSQVKEDEMIQLARSTPSMQAFCNALVERANFLGGQDNVTAVALKMTRTRPTIGDMFTDMRRNGRFSAKSVILGILLLAFLLGGASLLVWKLMGKGGLNGQRGDPGRRTAALPGSGTAYNSLSIQSEVPIKHVKVNEETRKLEEKSSVFVFTKDTNEVRIVPDFEQMKPRLYKMTMVGYSRNFSVVQSRTNRIVQTPDTITLYLTAGSRADYKVRHERTGDLYELRVDHLGSPFDITLESQENTSIYIAYQVIEPVSTPKKTPGGSVIVQPGKEKGEKLQFKLE